MKAVVQRVLNANVTVEGKIISSIGVGLCVLVGIGHDDTEKDLEYIAQKILRLKFFDSDDGKRWRRNIMDKQYEILCVSQFTLYHTLNGNKMDFHNAMPAASSEPFYNKFLETLKSKYKPELIKDGKFGASMIVNIANDGPVTLHIESPKPKVKDDPEEEKQDDTS